MSGFSCKRLFVKYKMKTFEPLHNSCKDMPLIFSQMREKCAKCKHERKWRHWLMWQKKWMQKYLLISDFFVFERNLIWLWKTFFLMMLIQSFLCFTRQINWIKRKYCPHLTFLVLLILGSSILFFIHSCNSNKKKIKFHII